MTPQSVLPLGLDIRPTTSSSISQLWTAGLKSLAAKSIPLGYFWWNCDTNRFSIKFTLNGSLPIYSRSGEERGPRDLVTAVDLPPTTPPEVDGLFQPHLRLEGQGLH